MSDFREFEGRNVDQAVFRAARELGRAPEDLEFEILERGGDRVRIRVDAGAQGAAAPAPASTAARPSGSGPGGSGAPRRHATPPPRGDRHERGSREAGPARGEAESEEAEPPWSGTPLYADLGGMVEALLATGGLDLSVEVQEEPDCERVLVDGPDAELLTEKEGEGLSALEHLLSKMALRGLGRRAKIRVDSAGFRKRREEEIVQMALQSAEKVKQEGGECATSPLNPYERRLVHLALKEDPSVITHSVGEGFLKKVTIRPSPRNPEES